LKASEELAWMVVHSKIPAPVYSEREQTSRAQRLFNVGRFDLASDAYRNLLKDKPSNTEMELKLATCLFKDRNNREAAQILKGLLNRNIPHEDRIEALHVLSKVFWRIERNADFVRCCQEIIQKGSRSQKDKALFNLAAHKYELGKLEEALAHFKRLLNSTPSISVKGDVTWKIAWIQYRTGKYDDAAEAFRQARVISPGGSIANASRYWQGRCLMRLNRSTEAKAILKQLARHSPLEYYGQGAERLLRSMGSPTSPSGRTEAFPNVTLSASHLTNERVAAANLFIESDLWDLALANLEALPQSLKSSPAIAFLTARAAHGAKQYKKARDILAGSFGSFMENPPDDAPAPFIELAFPRVHRKLTTATAKKHGVDPYLVWAVVRQESLYEASAVSPAGALGLMQITPAAAGVVRKGGVIAPTAIEKILDPEYNLSIGIRILSKNLAGFKGKIVPAVAAYNADIGKVRTWVRRNGKMDWDEFIENIPFLETRIYVKKVLAGYQAYSMLHRKTDLAGLW
jgi:soluble lytic murein transglycosylase